MYLINYAKNIFILICILAFLSSSVAQIQVLRSVNLNTYTDIVFLGARNMDADANQELVFYDFSPDRFFIVDRTTSTIEWDSQTEGFTKIEIAGYLEYSGSHNENFGYNTPFCDINNDGVFEIVFNAYDGAITRVYIVGSSGSTSVQNINILPTNTKLQQNYPNPFNPSTIIEYEIQQPGNVDIKIFNELGQIVRVLVSEEKIVGEYTAV